MSVRLHLRWLGALLLGWALLHGRPAGAQPAGCTNTYTATGTASGGTAGLYGEYYAERFHYESGFSEASPVTFFTNYARTGQPVRRVEATINYSSNAYTPPANSWTGITPPAGSGSPPTNFSARYRGSIFLKAGAAYTFYLTSDDASYLFLGAEARLGRPTPNNALILNGGDHGDVTVSNTFTKTGGDGLVDLQIIFAQGNGGATVRLEYAGGPDNLSRQIVPQSALCAGPASTTANTAPTAANISNVNIPNSNGATVLSPNLGAAAQNAAGFPGFYTITSLPSAGTLAYNGTAVTVGTTIAAGTLGLLTYAPGGAAAGSYSFQFTITDNQGQVSSAATYTLPVIDNRADLATVLTAVTTAPQGSLIYYNANVTNNGPIAVSGVNTTIQLPTGLTGVSLSNSGSYNASTGVASFPSYSLSVGQTVVRNIAFTMPGVQVTGTATSAAPSFPDPVASNNSSTTSTGPTQVADLSVAINGPARVIPNQAVVYGIVPTNLGPSTAVNVVLRMQLAANLSGVVVSNGGTYNASSGLVTWNPVTSLPNGGTFVYTVRFNAPSTVGGTINGVASGTSSTADGDPVAANNNGTADQANITTQVVGQSATLLCAQPGKDGSATLNTPPNTYYPGLNTVVAGATSLTVGPASTAGASTPLAAGDLVLIMQMQGANINTTDTDAYGDGIGGDMVASGQLLLDGSFTAGTYENAIVQSVSSSGGNTTITFTSGLGFGYVSAAATSTTGQRRYQVVRVPQYQDFSLSNNINVPRWNGLTGGLLVLDVNGTFDMAGFTINGAGRGFRGGAGQQLGGAGGITAASYRHSNASSTSGNKGEGIVGTPRFVNDQANFAAFVASGTGSPVLDTQASGLLPASVSDGYPNGDRARGAPGNAGGGGTDGNPGANDQNTGGGGGANAARGGVGGNGWDSNSMNGGFGGADYTVATPSRVVMGGGGGSGTTNNGTVADVGTYPANAGVPANGFASSGAAGGAIVVIRASRMSGNVGTIDVSGASMPYVPQNDASGGGGAGGSVVLLCNASANTPNSTALQNITILARGGQGGSNTGGGSPHGPGGGGSGGLIFASSAINAASSSDPGANGTTFGFAQYGSGVGAAATGQNLTNITRADLPNVVIGCPADVVTTLSTSPTAAVQVTSAAPGSNVTLYATTVNTGDGSGGGGAPATNVVVRIQLSPNLPAVTLNGQSGGPITNGVSTFPNGSTYNPTTGVLTIAPVVSLPVGASSALTNTIGFTMPAQNLLGRASSTANNDLDPRPANNDGTLPPANVLVNAVNDISGFVFDDVNYGGGAGRNFATANTSAISSGFASGAIGSPGTTVELYDNNGNFLQSTTTGPDGAYGFSGLSATTSYQVRVANATVKSARNPTATGLVPVQTFRTNNGQPDPNRVGGENPGQADAPINVGNALLTLAATNPNGDNNAAIYLDLIEVLDLNGNVVSNAIANPSFETPPLPSGGFQYGPTNASWTFNGPAGIANNLTQFGQPTGNTDQSQASFLQATASISQRMNLSPGTYRLRLRAGQKLGAPNQEVSVQVSGQQLALLQPPSGTGTLTTYAPTATFTVGTAGGQLSSAAQSVATVNLTQNQGTGVNFGFNFSTITNTNDTGQGSLRQFITNANALPNNRLDQDASSNGGPNPAAGVEKSIFMIPNGQAVPGLRAGLPNQLNASNVAVIQPNTAANGALPAITDANTQIDGNTLKLNLNLSTSSLLGTGGTAGTGNTALSQVSAPAVQLVGTPGTTGSDYGLNVQASNATITGLAIYGFGNTPGNATGADIYVNGNAIAGTTITGNVLGASAASFSDPGASARSQGNGIYLANLPANTVVSASITNNLIGFHGAAGIENLANSTPTSVNIQNNEIRGNALLNATSAGVRLGNYGGTVQGNLIADNRGPGVDLEGSVGYGAVTGNTVSGNGVAGTRTAGVRLVGTATTVSQNIINSNYGAGVQVLPTVVNNVISQNSTYLNGTITGVGNSAATGQIGIDIQVPGNNVNTGTAPYVTVNDMGDTQPGGNSALNFPVLLRSSLVSGTLTVVGYARPGSVIELFSTGTAPAANGFGQGRFYVTTATEGSGADSDPRTGQTYSGLINGLSQGTDMTNRFTFTITLTPAQQALLAGGARLTATATLPNVGTSEFSGNVVVSSTPLPVTLTTFTARALRTVDAQLDWTTASEQDNAYFEVQRSLDAGASFVTLGRVAGQGTKATATDYSYLDAGVGSRATGPVLYRLRQVDLDGTATFSPVRSVSFGAAADQSPALSVAPNPTRDAVSISLSGLPTTGTYSATLYDATGRAVRQLSLGASQAQTLDVRELASGVYLLRVLGADASGQAKALTQRLVKE